MGPQTRRATVRAALLAILAAGTPAIGRAQPLFFEAGLLVNHDPTLDSDTTTTTGVSGGVGLHLSAASVRLEFDLPPWHASHEAGRARLATRIEVYSVRHERRARSVSALVAWHIRPESRISVSVLGGGTAATRAMRSSGYVDYLTLDERLTDHREVANRSKDYEWPAITAGADVRVALTRHVSGVPQIRFHSYLFSEHTSELFVRPRLVVRWTF